MIIGFTNAPSMCFDVTGSLATCVVNDHAVGLMWTH